MYIIRETMYCKPGKVRPMVEKFIAMSKVNEKLGMGRMRVLTDMCAERYWTVVAEFEAPSLKAFEDMMSPQQMPADAQKKFEEIMAGYHDLVDHGKREVFKVEA